MRPLTLLLTTAALTASTLTGVNGYAAPKEPAAATSYSIATAPTTQDPLGPTVEQAEAALEEVQDLLDAPAGGEIERQDDADLTPALLELAKNKDELPASEEREADRILARPTDGEYGDPDGYETPKQSKYQCSAAVCVHYMLKTDDKYHGVAGGTANDANANGHPDYTDRVLTTLTEIDAAYAARGYRPPLRDGTKGQVIGMTSAQARLPDIYLANLGPASLFGYCTTDDPRASDYTVHRAAYSYCVLDNDYTDSVYGDQHTPTEFLQVTAAHEYFHAVQFGYDIAEDLWFTEGTAAWAEDEIYPAVNDNVNFLRGGPLTHPRLSMDGSNSNPYGAWIFFRYLSERFGASIVRTMWQRADAWTDGGRRQPRDEYSLQAVRNTVTPKSSWNDVWRRFADANRRPGLFYDDAATAGYPSAPLAHQLTMTTAQRTRTASFDLDHLAATSYRFTPEAGMRSGWKLKVTADGNPPSLGGAAIATILRADGTRKRVAFNFDAAGVRTTWLTFGTSNVKWVEVTMVNASTRYACWQGYDGFVKPARTCEGQPRDDNRVQKLTATAVKAG